MRGSKEERFWSKVQIGDADECWPWLAGFNAHGYGSFAWESYRVWSASRAAYQLAVGNIPPGLLVLHHCDNRACVNPTHLYIGTHADNARDRERRGRQIHARTETCARGHPWTPENTRLNPKPSRGGQVARICRECDKRRAQTYRDKKESPE